MAGWGTVVVASLVLAGVMPPQRRVLALAIATAIGVSVLGAGLTVAVHRRSGASSGRLLIGVAASLVIALAAGFGGYALPLPGYLAFPAMRRSLRP